MISETPSQPRLGRSSVAAALQEQPSTQLVVFVASLFEVLLAAPRGGTRRHLEGGRSCAHHQLRRKSISSVAAADAGDGSVPRPWAVDGASIGQLLEFRHRTHRTTGQTNCLCSEL